MSANDEARKGKKRVAPTSYRLEELDRERIRRLAQHWRVSDADVIRMLVAEAIRREGLPDTEPTREQ